jgi:microcystin-dependent protein
MPNLPLIPGTLGYTCYPANPQTLINDAFELGVAVQTGTLTGIIVSDVEPVPADRGKVWFRTAAGAPVFPSLWFFVLGQWLAKHPIPAGTLWAMPYTGAAAGIPTIDGGAAGAVNSDGTTGPFWEAVATLAGRVPIGAGTLPSGAVLAVGDTGGEDEHVLTVPELPSQNLALDPLVQINLSSPRDGAPSATGPFVGDPIVGTGKPITIVSGGQDEPHNTMPPYITLTFVRRTARQYCTTPIS